MTKESLTEFNRFRLGRGQPPIAPPSKYKEPRSLNMSDIGWDGLRSLALRLGYTTYQGGNITALLEAIGNGLWYLSPIGDNEEENKDAILQ
jgi:hypothetical protein